MAIYETKVNFHAEGDVVYGTETFYVVAESELEADNTAMKLSENSIYFDDRIDFQRGTEIEEFDGEVDDLPVGTILHTAPLSSLAPGLGSI